MKKTVIILIFSLGIINIYSQDTTNMVAYDMNYRFVEGVFLTFDQVKNNAPIQKSNIITNIDKTTYDFFDVLFLEDEITVIDENGNQKKYYTEDFWGYATNGKLYINWDYRPELIPIIGSISHFVGTSIYTDFNYNNDPFNTYSNDPFNTYSSTSTQKTEIKQYIIDFNTGKIYSFNYKEIDVLFSNDEELYTEWSDLSKRKKKKKLFVFLRKYNSRNPLLLPKN